MGDISARLRVDVHLRGDGFLDSVGDDVKSGLTASPKYLPPKYFYDEAGSKLFEEITALPEYYPTRAERQLLERIAPGLMATLRPNEIVELGSGSSAKTRILLGAPTAPQHLRRYIPFDVSEAMVRAAAESLLREYPYLCIHGVIGDFERHLPMVPPSEGKRLVLFLGGTIGNLEPEMRKEFLSAVGRLLGPEDRLLIGIDLVKKKEIIEAAYNDKAGVTAAFNANVLTVINRALDGNFDPLAFRHHAFFNEEASRIEMHLIAKSRQEVTLRAIGLPVVIEQGESIWTENSYKFTRESMEQALTDAGLRLVDFFTNEDPNQLFGLALAGPA